VNNIDTPNKKGSACQLCNGNELLSILVMDDDNNILEMASLMLGHFGYNVTTCINGEEAIEQYKCSIESGPRYLTVILDLKVEWGMGGKAAADQILLIDPDAKLIVSSGYSDDPIMANYENYGFYAALPKPYQLCDVIEILTSLQQQ
jgi:two-component system, cell cycle sensor histidine kinase and response regulator CckA